MSIEYCVECDKDIDTDEDLHEEHFSVESQSTWEEVEKVDTRPPNHSPTWGLDWANEF